MAIRRTDSRKILVSLSSFRKDTVEFRLYAIFDELPVSCGVDCALSIASRTVTGETEPLELFDGPPDIWNCDAKLSRNVAFLAHVTSKCCLID